MTKDYLAMLQPETGDRLDYGVKGMKWGVKRNLMKAESKSAAAEYLKKKDGKWAAKVEANPKLAKISAKANREARRMTKALNKDYKERGINLKKDKLARSRYDEDLKGILEQAVDRASYKVHKTSPSRLMEFQVHRHPDGSLTGDLGVRDNRVIRKQQGQITRAQTRTAKRQAKAVAKDAKAAAKPSVKHADIDETDDVMEMLGFEFAMTTDAEGFVADITVPGVAAHYDYLGEAVGGQMLHYGVKGMKWGVRRSSSELRTAAKTNPPAKKAVAKKPEAPASSSSGTESAAAKYSRLTAEVKAGRGSQMEPSDLAFFNTRTEALAKLNKISQQDPNWLKSTVKTVLKNTAQQQMQTVANGVAGKYVSGPILDRLKDSAAAIDAAT